MRFSRPSPLAIHLFLWMSVASLALELRYIRTDAETYRIESEHIERKLKRRLQSLKNETVKQEAVVESDSELLI